MAEHGAVEERARGCAARRRRGLAAEQVHQAVEGGGPSTQARRQLGAAVGEHAPQPQGAVDQ